MPSNIDRDQFATYELSVVATHPATPSSGDPVRYGEMTGIALVDEGTDIANETSVNFGPFIARLSVEAIDGGGASAVVVGDRIYYTDADTPVLNKKTTGRFYGFANEAIAAGAATIDVVHTPPSGV